MASAYSCDVSATPLDQLASAHAVILGDEPLGM